MSEAGMRICIVGDEFAAGVGDPKGLGWVGRVAGRTDVDPAPMFLTLAVPGETTAQMADRWLGEVELRLDPQADNRLVIALGASDVDHEVSLARSRLHLANVLDIATRRRLPTFVVGPPPSAGLRNSEIRDLSAAFNDVTARRGIPYVDVFTPLADHDQWLADLASGDGRHPSQAGYGLIAWLVLHSGWTPWLGSTD